MISINVYVLSMEYSICPHLLLVGLGFFGCYRNKNFLRPPMYCGNHYFCGIKPLGFQGPIALKKVSSRKVKIKASAQRFWSMFAHSRAAYGQVNLCCILLHVESAWPWTIWLPGLHVYGGEEIEEDQAIKDGTRRQNLGMKVRG